VASSLKKVGVGRLPRGLSGVELSFCLFQTPSLAVRKGAKKRPSKVGHPPKIPHRLLRGGLTAVLRCAKVI